MKTWLGFGDLALMLKVMTELNRSNLSRRASHLFSLKTMLVYCYSVIAGVPMEVF